MLELFKVMVDMEGKELKVHVFFDNEVTEMATEEELFKAMQGKFDNLVPIVSSLIEYLMEKREESK